VRQVIGAQWAEFDWHGDYPNRAIATKVHRAETSPQSQQKGTKTLIFPKFLRCWIGAALQSASFTALPKSQLRSASTLMWFDWLKASGPGYQTKANWLLRQAMLNAKKRSAGVRRARQRKRA
jgi:hypothetical protein